MLGNKYEQASAEVLEILENTNQEDVDKIPAKFIEYLKENSKKGYIPNLDHTKKINEMDLRPETKELLGVIYRNWWASPEEKEKIYNNIKEKNAKEQKEAESKYSYENLFKRNNVQNENINTESTNEENINNESDMVEYKENIFKKFIKLIKNIFNRRV